MQKLALYRKYRPDDFDQIVGQQHIKTVLSNAITEGKASHAYLFSGPRGTGKTSVARIFAKAINCNNRKDYNPCGKCSICKGMVEGRILDLIEIDAASNRGIDEIRDLREKVKFAPTEGKFKVFIIDEVHMLTKEAFNALLKTLEEPPTHAIFVLATTEINKVPTTIVSRCQRHDFRRIKMTDLVSRLAEIKDKEKIKISNEAMELIAETSEGGLRDALSLLDQLSSVGLEKIEENDVEAVLGLAPNRIVTDITKALLVSDSKKALEVIEKSAKDGVDLVVLTKSIGEFLRKLISIKLSGTSAIEGTKEQVEELKEIATNTEKEIMISVLDSIFWAQSVFKTNIDPRTILTVVAAKEYKKKSEIRNQRSENREQLSVEKIGDSENKQANPKKQATQPDQKPVTSAKKPNGKWQHFLMEIKAKNNTIHAFMRVASPHFNDNEVTLLFPYKFHKERIEEPKTKRVVEDLLHKVYGEDICIKCELEGNHRNHRVDDADTAASILGGEIVE